MPEIPYHVLDEMRESTEFKGPSDALMQEVNNRLEALQNLMLVAILMSQELQEFIDDAIAASGDETALSSTQELLADWDRAYADIFQNEY
jgi:hypothetical protein